VTESQTPLLVTKLYRPPLRANHVSRAALLRRLDGGLSGRLIVVLAAAGFGKTTLLADWTARHDSSVAWLSLDAADNHPARFVTYVVEALRTRFPGFGGALLAELHAAQAPSEALLYRQELDNLAAYLAQPQPSAVLG
jgi:LuxR family maltose regulon positive regulatory protein